MRLLDHATNTYSQVGQDGIFAKILGEIGVYTGYCVEFGAWDGQRLSNTRRLLEQGWTGMQMEGDAQKANELAALYEDRDEVVTLNTYVTHEGDTSLDSLLDAHGAPDEIDLMSIDVDGQDWHIWNAFESRKPKIMCVETNVTIPMYIDYVTQLGVNAIPLGASPLAVFRLGLEKGYKAVCYTSHDWIFVREDLYEQLDIDATSYAELYFDGTWHRGDAGMPSPLGQNRKAREQFEQCLAPVFAHGHQFKCLTGGADLSMLWQSQR